MTGRRQVPHDRAELRSPLPPPSAKARRFMPPDPDPDPYPAEAYIEPTEALAKSAALAQARREAEQLAANDMPQELNTDVEPPLAPGGGHV